MKKHASYVLNSYSYLKSYSVEQLLQVGMRQAEEIPIPSFDENLLINLCSDAQNVFKNEDVILNVDGDVIVVGDIHGSLHDLLRILKYIELNTQNVIFLGDYVDRGSFSLECITLLFSIKILYPNRFYLLRGNHEFDVMCSQYGFKKEILNYHNPKRMIKTISDQNDQAPIPESNYINFDEALKNKDEETCEQLCDSYIANHINMNCYKYTEKLYDSFIKAFSYLPIAAIVNNTSLCIHGGLSPILDKIGKIKKCIQRPIENYDQNELLCDLLWGDPSDQLQQLYEVNPRGRGHLFNGVVVVNFLKNNNLQRIIRAHQCVTQGVEKMFNEKCITVFSASSYSNDMGNCSGILKLFQKDDKVRCVKFDPLHRLNKYDAIYYKVQAFNEVNDESRLHLSAHLRSMASSTYFNVGMSHSKSIDNSSIVLPDNEEKQHINHCTSTYHFIRQNSSICNSQGKIIGSKGRKIHHCCSLFSKDIHHHLNFTQINRRNTNIDGSHDPNSDADDNEELIQSVKPLPKLAQKVVL